MSRKKYSMKLWAVMGLVLLAALAGSVAFVALARNAAASNDPAPERPRVTIPTRPPSTVALWVGDSFTMGIGAPEGYSYPRLVSVGMGWVEAIDGQSGSGFVADGKNNAPNNVPLPARLNNFTGTPQIVLVDGGRNDWNRDFETETAPAVRAYLDRAQAKWPAAKIILLVPFNVASTEANPDFVNLFTEEAARRGGIVLDPVSEGWLNKQTMADMIYSDGVHPDKAGHAYIAERLTARLKELGITPAPQS